jgi:hypothetical protein
MSTPAVSTIPLLTYSPPRVNAAGEVEVMLHADGRLLRLTGSGKMFDELAADIKNMPPPPHNRAPLTPEQTDLYRGVVALVNAGATWQSAAAMKGVSMSAARHWWDRENARRHAAAESRAPVLKPSGEIL